MGERVSRLVCGVALVVLGVVAGGCGCTATVTVRNDTPHHFHAMLSTPSGAYQMFHRSCFYEFGLLSGQTWRSADATRAEPPRDLVHGGVMLELATRENGQWTLSRAWRVDLAQRGRIVISGSWPDLGVEATDRDGDPVGVRPAGGTGEASALSRPSRPLLTGGCGG